MSKIPAAGSSSATPEAAYTRTYRPMNTNVWLRGSGYTMYYSTHCRRFWSISELRLQLHLTKCVFVFNLITLDYDIWRFRRTAMSSLSAVASIAKIMLQ